MVWVLPPHENEVQNKHVESVWFPCLDEGSTPSRSTIRCQYDLLSAAAPKGWTRKMIIKELIGYSYRTKSLFIWNRGAKHMEQES